MFGLEFIYVWGLRIEFQTLVEASLLRKRLFIDYIPINLFQSNMFNISHTPPMHLNKDAITKVHSWVNDGATCLTPIRPTEEVHATNSPAPAIPHTWPPT